MPVTSPVLFSRSYERAKLSEPALRREYYLGRQTSEQESSVLQEESILMGLVLSRRIQCPAPCWQRSASMKVLRRSTGTLPRHTCWSDTAQSDQTGGREGDLVACAPLQTMVLMR